MALTRSKKIYLTTSVFFAFIDRHHPKHTQAEAYLRYFAQENFHIYTASFSVIRAYDQIRRNISYTLAKEFLRAVNVGSMEILYPDESTVKAALKLVLTTTDQDLGIELALINVLSDTHQIPQIATFEYSRFFFGIQPFILPY